MKKIMKFCDNNFIAILITSIIVIIVFFISSAIKSIIVDNKKENTTIIIEGTIIEKKYDFPTSGYKSNREGEYVIIISEKRNQILHLIVNPDTYYKCSVGKFIRLTSTWYKLKDKNSQFEDWEYFQQYLKR